MAQRVRSWTVQNEMRGVLGRVSTGAAERIFDSYNDLQHCILNNESHDTGNNIKPNQTDDMFEPNETGITLIQM